MLPDASPYYFDDCASASEIDGSIQDINPDGWVLFVTDDDGLDPEDDEDNSTYCKTGVFDHDCQSAVYELSVRTFFGISPVHNITDLVLICGLRDGVKDLTIVISMDGVGFTDGSPLDWLQIDDGESGTMDAFFALEFGTDDKQHVYRVEKDSSAGTITLFVDRVQRLEFDYDELSSSSANISHLATTSSPGESEFYMRYYRHRVGSTEFQTTGVGCDADFDDDDDVDTADLLALFENWGACPELPNTCEWDLNDDDEVNTSDLLILFASWGDPCT